jgi:hypothetical protein
MFVTDGYCGVSDPLAIEERKKKEDKIVGIISHSSKQDLTFADSIYYASKEDGISVKLVAAGRSVL